jgi:hypothetical protein
MQKTHPATQLEAFPTCSPRRSFGAFLAALYLFALGSTVTIPADEVVVKKILVPPGSHPALIAAAKILAHDFSLKDSDIVAPPITGTLSAGDLLLTTNPPTAAQAALLNLSEPTLPPDGYGIIFSDAGIQIFGQRPRSLLFAAGDVNLWKGQGDGVFARHPAFAFRSAGVHGRLSMPEYVAALGINAIIGPSVAPVTLQQSLPEVYANLSPSEQSDLNQEAASAEEKQRHLAEACHAADVEYYPLLYGNDFRRWSPSLYDAAIKTYPSARGTNAIESWEKGTLCPSDPQTWKLIQAYVREFIQRSHGDGLYTTFWDNYGIYCQCDRCANDGLNQFPNELLTCVSNYSAVTTSLNCKLIVRTWSSGAAHWLGDQWVNAPGNGGPSGTATQLWAKVISQLPANIVIQSKVYEADCQPDSPFSELLGHAAPHQEVAESQITGQTTGRFFLPASTVDYTAWTMKQSHDLIGSSGGASLFPGGTKNPHYDLFADIVNGINAYAWRELSWNPSANVSDIWLAWARPIYGDKAAPAVIRLLRRSESVINRLFSTLGLGNDTNSGFPGNIARRETLLKYTNRYFRPEGQAALEPTLDNINRVIAEKADCLREIEAMQADLDEAAADLQPEQLVELRTRLNWLAEFAQVARYLDESLWRYRYLRHQSEMLVTDPGQMKYLANAYDQVQKHYKLMFRYNPDLQFSCYDVTLDKLPAKPSLGNPIPLMTELYQASLACVQQTRGPQSVPPEWLRSPTTTNPAPADSKDETQ